jgi:hypothetical protein
MGMKGLRIHIVEYGVFILFFGAFLGVRIRGLYLGLGGPCHSVRAAAARRNFVVTQTHPR